MQLCIAALNKVQTAYDDLVMKHESYYKVDTKWRGKEEEGCLGECQETFMANHWWQWTLSTIKKFMKNSSHWFLSPFHPLLLNPTLSHPSLFPPPPLHTAPLSPSLPPYSPPGPPFAPPPSLPPSLSPFISPFLKPYFVPWEQTYLSLLMTILCICLTISIFFADSWNNNANW